MNYKQFQIKGEIPIPAQKNENKENALLRNSNQNDLEYQQQQVQTKAISQSKNHPHNNNNNYHYDKVANRKQQYYDQEGQIIEEKCQAYIKKYLPDPQPIRTSFHNQQKSQDHIKNPQLNFEVSAFERLLQSSRQYEQQIKGNHNLVSHRYDFQYNSDKKYQNKDQISKFTYNSTQSNNWKRNSSQSPRVKKLKNQSKPQTKPVLTSNGFQRQSNSIKATNRSTNTSQNQTHRVQAVPKNQVKEITNVELREVFEKFTNKYNLQKQLCIDRIQDQNCLRSQYVNSTHRVPYIDYTNQECQQQRIIQSDHKQAPHTVYFVTNTNKKNRMLNNIIQYQLKKMGYLNQQQEQQQIDLGNNQNMQNKLQ